jgi:heme/copper-type cytochrome/quinol oxidase subunit 3
VSALVSAAPADGISRATRHRENTAVLGMVLFIASWAMLFAALFFAYGFTRVRAVAWPPLDLPRLPLGWPALATVAIAGTSAALVFAQRAARAQIERRRVGIAIFVAIIVAILGALVFLAVQVHVWRALMLAGLRPDGGPYASVFYGLTTFHALHVAVGIVGLATLLPRLRGNATLSLRLWTLYMHMVGVLWALLYIGVYLL